MNSEIDRAEARVSEDVPCLGCGCLCDDIRVRLEGNRVAGFDYACPIGERWFSADRPGDGHPASTIDGRAAGLDESLDRAAAILRRSRSPVIWGLTGSTIEGVASALALADRIGAVVDLAGSPGEVAILRAFQNVGRVSATLGEVKDRADVVVFWDLDPLVTHPRHRERYSVEPAGRFIPEGRAGRFVIVAGAEPSESSRRADLFIPIDPNRSAETFEALRALTQGIETDRVRTSKASGMPMGTLEALVNRLRSARYGAWFFGPSIGPGSRGAVATHRRPQRRSAVRRPGDGSLGKSVGRRRRPDLAGGSPLVDRLWFRLSPAPARRGEPPRPTPRGRGRRDRLRGR